MSGPVAAAGAPVGDRDLGPGTSGGADDLLLPVLLAHHGIAWFAIDFATGSLTWSPELRRLLGYGPDVEATTTNYVRRVHREDRDRFIAWADAALLGPTTSTSRHRIWPTDRTTRTVTMATTHLGRHLIGSVIDETEQVAELADLRHRSSHDPLTCLPNREVLHERCDRALAERPDRVTVVLADIDAVSVVNRSLGHAVGDGAITWVAARLEQAAHPSDTVSQFAGNQFAVLCPHCVDPQASMELARRLLRSTEGPTELFGAELDLQLSLGVATTHGRAPRSRSDLIRQADLAMGVAKRTGKGRAVLFDANLQQADEERTRLESVVRHALDAGTVEVHFQPIVDLVHGEVWGAEALIRLADPDGEGWVRTDEAVAAAEQAGLMPQLGAAALRSACRTAARWRSLRPERRTVVSVNISTAQLLDVRLLGQVVDVLEDTGLDPDRLCLEISEPALMGDLQLASARLDALRHLGIVLAADDFGTGWSNLTHLKRLPLDLLKADRSYVSGIDHDPDDNSILGAVLRLGDSLGLDVVAEGLERPEQVQEARRLGCRLAQGYHFSRPLDGAAFADLLTDRDDRGWGARGSATSEPDRAGPLPFEAGDALRAITHEIRNPLTVVAGNAELLDGCTPQELTDQARSIRRGVQRIENILRYLDDVATVDGAQVHLSTNRVPLADLVTEVVQEFRATHPDRPVVLERTSPVEETTAEADEAQLAQAITNLLGNADKYSPPGPAVEVGVRASDGTCTITVADHGPGIPLASVHTAFRKFARIDRSTKGSGLGLYLSRGIALAHGGDISYRPRPDGTGAVFDLVLPTTGGTSGPGAGTPGTGLPGAVR